MLNLTGPVTVPVFSTVRSMVVVVMPLTIATVPGPTVVALYPIPVPLTCIPATIVETAPGMVRSVVPTAPDTMGIVTSAARLPTKTSLPGEPAIPSAFMITSPGLFSGLGVTPLRAT